MHQSNQYFKNIIKERRLIIIGIWLLSGICTYQAA